MTDLKQTPLHALHLEMGGKMVPFAGYEMPVQYKGILAEHQQVRDAAGLFDVSHMGQAFIIGPDHETSAKALEALVPGEIQKLAPGRMRYTMLLNQNGGILDDLMVTRAGSEEFAGFIFIVVNAACKDADFALIRASLPDGVVLDIAESKALLALQGPKAASVLAGLAPEVADLSFMSGARLTLGGVEGCIVTRSGYTGEDGYEISVPADKAEALARQLIAHPDVEPIGLGARDSLRLEAGLCLYGHDIDETTTPVEANLTWAIGKRRREEGGFPGATKILDQLANGTARKRIGLVLEDRAPAREGTPIVNDAGEVIGKVTSGTIAPTLGRPVAMGYVASDYAAADTQVGLDVRGKIRVARVSKTPFVLHRYHKP